MSTYKKLMVVEKGKDFRKAAKVVEVSFPSSVGADEVLVMVFYAGVNATDINAIENRYGPKLEVPYGIGLECLGQVVKVGENVSSVIPGDFVVSYFPGGFTEYHTVPASACMPIPEPDPKYLAFCVSGLTAAVSIGELAKPKPSDVVLVTAAAGGTGTMAVQILKKLYKCRVVGTCSTQEKAEYLKSLGCDSVIDYTQSKEKVTREMTIAAPNGFNVIYECVGGSLRQLALQNIAVHGRVLLIGSVSGYKDGSSWLKKPACEGTEAVVKSGLILRRCVSMCGFLLSHYRDVIPKYYKQLLTMYAAGNLSVRCDPKGMIEELKKTYQGVEYLMSGKSYGKVIVKVADPKQ